VKLIIAGTEGQAMIVDKTLHFESKKLDGSSLKEPWTDLPAPLPAPLHQFVDAVAGGDTTHLVTPAEAAARVVVMAAMYEADEQNAWVEIS
jgi:predicted dehydrogenase